MKTLLLIDDDPNILTLMAELLAKNYTVLTASSGHSGLEVLRNQPIDVVLCDVIMPGLDGYQVLEQVRLDPAISKQKIVLMSAYAFDYRSQYLADGYVSKPIHMRELRALLASLIKP